MENKQINVPGCKDVVVKDLLTENGLQIMKVNVGVGGEIPLHKHGCMATMVITEGQAKILGKNGGIAKKGDVVTKVSNELHGFTDVKGPFSFVSISSGKGIMQENIWDMDFLN